MLNSEKLIRKIDYLDEKKVYLIISELSQDLEDELRNETIELDKETLKVLKYLIKTLVENDSTFAQKVNDILIKIENQTPKDITIATNGGVFSIPLAEVGLFLSFLLARDLIRAFKPSKEIKETEIDEKKGTKKSKNITERNYNADLIGLAKAYFESKKGE